MSFVGDLEHLPIVDLIQLLHSTKKSGTLALKSKRGHSQIVFDEGYIVSANHHNNSIRVGQILVDMKAITAVQLESALQEQKDAGRNRRPLVATLIENGLINKDIAFKGLEMLIEMTIVDVLTWTCGTFELEMDKQIVSDEYRYFPDTLKETLNLNAQSILMDALRIYDEKKRDGTLGEATFAAGEEEEPEEDDTPLISASDLGLDDLDNLDRKIPEVFAGVKFFDPAEDIRQKLKEELKDIPADEQQKLVSYMVGLSGTSISDSVTQEASGIVVVIFSCDRLATNLLTAACKADRLAVFTTDNEADLDPLIDKALAKDSFPLVIIDAGENHSGLIKAKLSHYGGLSVIKLASEPDVNSCLAALRDGVRTIFPKPDMKNTKVGFAEESIRFIESFRSYMQKNAFGSTDPLPVKAFNRCIQELDAAQEIPDISFALLKFVSEIFERSITFIVTNGELIAERGIGTGAYKNADAAAPLRFKISLASPSVFQRTIDNVKVLFERAEDEALKSLYREIDAPAENKVLIVPIVSFGRVIALTYADFGTRAAGPAPTDMIASLAKHGSLIFDNILMRKKLEKKAH
ncbi:DUF4388 domain-containing protein [Geotalea sp. SG265]|uniref:DUF4388 domain-containing protein n=1 Tax=Geotalea sp. SG265 TaxID=2922867 RepID=UPI001FB0202F|nr:DUF4388 domain-containing protein [Geotalea sp. SG265]